MALALVIAVLLFLFMIGLVANKQNQMEVDQVFSQVSLIQPPPEQDEPEQLEPEQQEAPSEAEPEPTMDMIPAAAPIVMDAPSMDMPTTSIAPSELVIPSPSAKWSSSLSGAGLGLGEKDNGYIEVVPYSTRQPNIPDMAWKNKIDGWVLVAFTLNANGRSKNIRILDSYPRGIFEETAIKAVSDWIYDMRNVKAKGEIILTQRIELFWKDYPKNNLQLDL